MTTTLRDFIANREAEIRDQLKALKREQKELQLARAALDGNEPAPATPSGGPTIKEMARSILSTPSAQGGLTAVELLEAMKVIFDREIDRTSLSPQLSRLKAEGEVALNGDRWFIAAAHQALQQKLMLETLMDDEEKPPPDWEVIDDDDSAPF